MNGGVKRNNGYGSVVMAMPANNRENLARMVFTTGQVAKLCRVAPRTVSKWFDSKKLKGYRIPGSDDRRIPREELLAFLKEHGIPAWKLLEEQATPTAVLCGHTETVAAQLAERFSGFNCQTEFCRSTFHLGIRLAEKGVPACLLVDRSLGLDSVRHVAATVREMEGFPVGRKSTYKPIKRLCLLALVVGEDESDPSGYVSLGYDAVYQPPLDTKTCADEIARVILSE